MHETRHNDNNHNGNINNDWVDSGLHNSFVAAEEATINQEGKALSSMITAPVIPTLDGLIPYETLKNYDQIDSDRNSANGKVTLLFRYTGTSIQNPTYLNLTYDAPSLYTKGAGAKIAPINRGQDQAYKFYAQIKTFSREVSSLNDFRSIIAPISVSTTVIIPAHDNMENGLLQQAMNSLTGLFYDNTGSFIGIERVTGQSKI
nr:MAG: hypothetical protein [Eriocheir sinensis blumevirus 2]